MNLSVSHANRFRLSLPFIPFLGPNEKGEGLLLFCSEVNLPEISITADEVKDILYTMKVANGEFKCGDITLTYAIDEKFANYTFLYNWMNYIKNPAKVSVKQAAVDAALHIYSNNNNPLFAFTLKNIFPIQMDSIKFTTKEGDNRDLEQNITFACEYFTLGSQ